MNLHGDAVALDISGAVARIVLNDPDNRNAVTAASSEAFLSAAKQAANDGTVRVIVLTGTGAFFSPGGDIGEFLAAEDDLPGHLAVLTGNIHAGIRHLVQAPAPVIVGLNGIAAGGGVGMMLAGDLIIAKRSARINSGYTRSGLTPDAGLSWFLSRLTGHARAFEMLAFNEFLSADRALELGIVNQVVDDDRFDAAIDAAVERLLALPGSVLGDTKRLLRQAVNVSLDSHLDTEASAIAARVGMAETVETLRSFVKR